MILCTTNIIKTLDFSEKISEDIIAFIQNMNTI